MKLDRTFLLGELPTKLRAQIEEVTKEHMIGLVNDYNEAIRKHGKYIEFADQEELAKHLLGSANVKLKIAAELDDTKLDKWHIYPVNASQSRLTEYHEHLDKRRQAAAEQRGE